MSFESSPFFSVGAYAFKTFILHTNKVHSLNCCYYSVAYKKSCSQLMIFAPFSIEKNIILCSYSAPLPHLTSCTPAKSDLQFANSMANVMTLTSTGSLHSTYQISCPFSITQVGPAEASEVILQKCKYSQKNHALTQLLILDS